MKPTNDKYPRTAGDEAAEVASDTAWQKLLGEAATVDMIEPRTNTQLILPETSAMPKRPSEIIEKVGFTVTDHRVVTPQQIKADEAKKAEALRAPLSPKEIVATVDTIAAVIFSNPATFKHLNQADLMGLFRLREMLNGDQLPYANDRPDKNMPDFGTKKRLQKAVDLTVGYRIVDPTSRTILPRGYDGYNHYAAVRALTTLDTLSVDPAATRKQFTTSPSEASINAVLVPLMVSEDVIVPPSQLFDNSGRYVLNPTAPSTFFAWANSTRR